MADNARFHNKYHRRNHHTLPSAGFPDSGSDPIASQAEPFQGSFYVQGSLSASNDLTIGGNTIIYGNLSALGDVSVIDTFVTVTSALSVVNKGTGPALTVIQEGIQDIAVFLDDTQNALKIMDSAKIRFFEEGSSGAIGINTTNLSNALTIKGSVSASGSLNINGSTTLGDTNTDTNILRGIVKIADSSASNGILLGSGDASYDANLYRSTANTLKTDDNFIIDLDLNVNGNTTLGNANTDTTTINGTNVSIPNNLNIDSNTLYIDSSNDRVGIGTATPNAKLTVSGDISAANSVAGVSLSGRFVDISHTPANDGSNPYLRIGEATSDAVNFSGFKIEYSETVNDLNLSAIGFNTSKEALKITSAGNTRINLLSAISPNYNNLTAVTRGISGAGFDNLSHLINGRIGINNQAPVSSYALHVKGGNIRVDGVDFSAVPGFDGTIYDSDGQSLFDLRSAQENANYSLSIASSGLNNFMKFFGGRSLDQNPFVAVRKGQPIRFAQLNNFYGQGFSEVARIGGNSNVSIGLSADGAERLTVLGNISASGTLSAGGTGGNYFTGAVTVGDPVSAIKFIVAGNGNVGVNTATPNEQLTVSGNISANGYTITAGVSVLKPNAGADAALMILAGNNSGDAASLFFGNNVAVSGHNRGQIRYYNGGVEAMAFSTSSVEAMRIRAGGQVGIGTTLPAEKLTVSGNISSNGTLFTKQMTAYGLDLVHIPITDGIDPILRIGESSTDSPNLGFSGAYISYDEITNTFGISSVFAPAMGMPAIAIDRNSNVGIGTNTPEQKLHVLKASAGTVTADTNSIAVFEGGSNAHISILTPDAQTGGVVFGSPTDNLGSYLTWNYTNNALKLATAKTNGYIQLLTDNEAEAARITSSGNVGIGTTVPTEKLTVSGNISSNGTLFTTSITSRGVDLIHTPFNDGTNPVLRFGESDYGTGSNGFSGAIMSYNENTNVFGISSVFAPAMATPAMSIDRNGNFFTSSNASPKMTIAYAMTSANFLLSATSTTNEYIPLFKVPSHVLYYVPGIDMTFTVENFAGGNQLGTDQMPVFRLTRDNSGTGASEMSVDVTPFTNTNLYNTIGWNRQSTNTQSGKAMALPGDTVYLKVKTGYNNTGGATTAYSILSGRVILTGYYILP